MVLLVEPHLLRTFTTLVTTGDVDLGNVTSDTITVMEDLTVI